MVVIDLFDEVCHDMTLQMIDIYQRDAQGASETFGKAHPYEQRPHQAWPARKGYCT